MLGKVKRGPGDQSVNKGVKHPRRRCTGKMSQVIDIKGEDYRPMSLPSSKQKNGMLKTYLSEKGTLGPGGLLTVEVTLELTVSLGRRGQSISAAIQSKEGGYLVD